MASYRDLIRADSPSLYWPLDATYGATDQSGNSRNGTGGGGVSIGGYSGSPITGETTATDLDGSNDRVTSAYNPFATSSVRTFEGWAYRDTSSSYDVLAASGAASNYVMIQIVGSSTNVDIYTNAGVVVPSTFASAWPGNTQWVHWAVILDDSANTYTLYINGVSKGTNSAALSYAASPGNLQLGAEGSGFSNPFDGKMAHFAVFERALTASEIKSHYTAGVQVGLVNLPFVHQAGRTQ